MYVLGINSYSHDSGACIIHDDGQKLEIVAIAESRLNRVKRSLNFPLHSIKYCLEYFSLNSTDQIDLVCGVKHKTGQSTDDVMLEKTWLDRAINNDVRADADFKSNYILNNSFFRSFLNVHWCHHMDAHAASAHYMSGFDHSATLCIDAGGVGIYEGNGLSLKTIDRCGYSDKTYENGDVTVRTVPQEYLGTLFMNATRALNFSTDGTTMALACFAKQGAPFHKLGLQRGWISDALGFGQLKMGNPEEVADFIRLYKRQIGKVQWFAKCHKKDLEKFHRTKHQYSQRSDYKILRPAVDLAYKTQTFVENEMVRLAKLAKSKTGASKLCIAGGIGLSCVTNRIIYDLNIFEDIFIQPAASDEGLALGAALTGYYKLLKGVHRIEMKNAYLGRAYSTAEVERAASVVGLEPGVAASARDVAQLIADGAVIGRFFGRSEFGPRALGNRSILADPRNARVSQRINEEIKQREWFRPFAPSCTIESRDTYFDMPMPGPFMIVAASLRAEFHEKLAAIRHVDNSSRPQTVDYSENPEYYNLLREFGEITGYYVLLNTSFNSRTEPIVETPLEAIMSSIEIGLDYLYIEKTLYKISLGLKSRVQSLRQNYEDELLRRYQELRLELTPNDIRNNYEKIFAHNFKI